MRAFIVIAVAVLLASLGYYVLVPHHAPLELPAASPAYEPPTTTISDATEVFQKAFWKRPTAADKILNAERREWADADGVKRWQWFIAVALAARADLLPPVQDTASSKGKLSSAGGKATTLAVSATGKAFVLFNLNSLPVDVLPADIANARLRVYFPMVSKVGDIAIHTVLPVGTVWNETATTPEPAVSVAPVATLPSAMVVGKTFVEVDVTPTVRAWRAAPGTNFGFAFLASGITKVTLGAKEGTGSGYPAELEVEIDRTTVAGSIGATQLADGAVTNAKLASSGLTITAGTGLSGGGLVMLGGNVTVSLGSNLALGGTTNPEISS